MKIFIPTYKRVEKQKTWDNLPDFVKEYTYVCCPESEAEEHRTAGRQVFSHPDDLLGIAPKRDWIIENSDDDQVMMIDDDQSFACRRDGMYKLRGMEDEDWENMLAEIVHQLDKFNAVGVSAQAGNNNSFPKEIISPGRMHNTYAFNRNVLIDEGIRFDRVKVMEDFHVTLELLKRGMPNVMLQNWCWAQSAANAAGGCSEWRDGTVQAEGALLLAELHAPYVKVVEKESKAWVGMEKRLDVRIQWKKCLTDALKEK